MKNHTVIELMLVGLVLCWFYLDAVLFCIVVTIVVVLLAKIVESKVESMCEDNECNKKSRGERISDFKANAMRNGYEHAFKERSEGLI